MVSEVGLFWRWYPKKSLSSTEPCQVVRRSVPTSTAESTSSLGFEHEPRHTREEMSRKPGYGSADPRVSYSGLPCAHTKDCGVNGVLRGNYTMSDSPLRLAGKRETVFVLLTEYIAKKGVSRKNPRRMKYFDLRGGTEFSWKKNDIGDGSKVEVRGKPPTVILLEVTSSLYST
uniref:Uncharacterized protein n=1 Tax=Vespula pensylvanica TaxID=30213 RepID=A0A834N757_VESPE|nr:hypothetical protein H0235_016395 [Vespula pensylvanica]